MKSTAILVLILALGLNISISQSKRNVLIVTAHPDDWEIVMGGTAYLLKDKYQIHVAIASRGERGFSKEPKSETAAIRTKEAECSAAKIGAKLNFLGKIDGDIYADSDAVKQLVTLMKTLDPAITFVMWPFDKPDHAAASNMAILALNKSGIAYDHEVYLFDGGHGSTSNHFIPDIYVNITPVWLNKQEIVNCHAVHNKDSSLSKMVENENKTYGYINRTPYAEGFKPLYPLTNGRWDSNKKIKCTLLDL
ncbi:MAG: PIG-L deacetylase family protein [Bacteroidota bacterium]|nr:PIG-L deacetylase family protein [Bacteroidota bacterium]